MRVTGEAFAKHAVAFDRVLTSPWCRCKETAQLATGREAETFAPLSNLVGRSEHREAQVAALKSYLAGLDRNVRVLFVTHGIVINALTGIQPASGEMVIVNDSPSISISRRMVFWSLVGMEDWYPSRFGGFGAYGFFGPQTDEPARPLSGPSSQHIIDEPLPLLLPNDGISDDSALLEHVVGWLEDALKV